MLLLENPGEDFDEEVLNIQSMLEDETEEQTGKVINDDIEIIARDVDEEVLNIQSMLEDKTEEQTVKVINDDIEIIARDVDETTNDSSSTKDEADIAIVPDWCWGGGLTQGVLFSWDALGESSLLVLNTSKVGVLIT